MKKAWHSFPDMRPSFTQFKSFFKNLLDKQVETRE